MKVFTAGMPDLCAHLIEHIKENMKDIVIENNFEQVIAIAKSGELEKLCIFMDVWNVSGRHCNGMRGQGAAELIHEIDPSIEILIWDGREYTPEDFIKDLPPAFQVSGEIHPIKNPNELYVQLGHFDLFNELTYDFFEEILTEQEKQLCDTIC